MAETVPIQEFTDVMDLTTRGIGVSPDTDPLVYRHPRVDRTVPGKQWLGKIGQANALIRLPDAKHWNGKLMIGATPAVRTEQSLDLVLSDLVLQQGYAFAACDKATPGITLRDPARSIAEWPVVYAALTEVAQTTVREHYGTSAARTYISGISNGGYVTRRMIETYPQLYDGGMEWEGAFWHSQGRHLLTTLPVYLDDYPIYVNWRGDRTATERHQAYERLLEAGLHADSEPYWNEYFMIYWVVSLWLYGRNLDPEWAPFAQDWSNDWMRNPAPLARYPWRERADILATRIAPIQNTGVLRKPLLSVAGNWDCLVDFPHHAQAYADYVGQQGYGSNHRLYEIDRGNHVDGLLKSNRGRQQPVQPYYEAALHHLENWIERGLEPPASGRYERISEFWQGSLYCDFADR